MMQLLTLLDEFSGSITRAAADAPDNYPEWLPLTWHSHRVELLDLWSKIRPQLRHDLDKTEILENRLTAMLVAFDAGNKELGRKIAWEIYNFHPEKLR
jgi:hypothetical protein